MSRADTQEIIDKIESGKIKFGPFEAYEISGANGNGAYRAKTAVGTISVTRYYTGCDTWSYDAWLNGARLRINAREVFQAIWRLEHRNDPDLSERWANESKSAMRAIRSL